MASTTGLLSKGAKLSYKEGSGSYTELVNLQEVPDLGSAPETVDVTCLADANKRSINGLVDFGTLEFTFLYDAALFATIKGLEGKDISWQFELPDVPASGEHGTQFSWTGTPTAIMSGATVNGALAFKINISVSSDMEFTTAA